MHELKVLFVTRNYPPAIGGMEKYSYDLYYSLKDIINITLLANSKGKLFLPGFILHIIFHLFCNKKKYTNIHFSDGVLAPVAYIAKVITGSKITITMHGLDITYKSYFYQKLIPFCLSKLDKVICVSNYTIKQCIERGINKDNCIFIPNGIRFNDTAVDIATLGEIENKHGIKLTNKQILFSVCRFIKRKGISWFIKNVFPKLPDNYIYVIAGYGPEMENIYSTIKECNQHNKVFLIGKISEREKLGLFQHARLFIMPNIKIEGDMEGFGITLIESASHGLPSIASRIDGIPEAVVNGKTGLLVNERDSQAFVDAINSENFDREEVKKYSRKYFDWSKLKDRYLEVFAS